MRVAGNTKTGLAYSLREATGDDASELIAYIEKVCRESNMLQMGPGEFGIDEAEEVTILNDYLNAPHKLFLLAVVDDRIAGSLSFSAGHRPRVKHYGEFGLSVAEQFWGQGLGGVLLDALFEWACQGGVVKKINLKVNTLNERAVALYLKKGFVFEGKVEKDLCIEGEYFDHHIMGKSLF